MTLHSILDAATSQGIPIRDRIDRQNGLSERPLGLGAHTDGCEVGAHLHDGIDIIAIQGMQGLDDLLSRRMRDLHG